MTFQPGHLGGPGRPKGSRNKLAETFLEALHADFQKNGAAAIEAARAESPLGYVKIVAALLPQKLEMTPGGGSVSDEDLLAIIRSAANRDDGDTDSDAIGGSVH